MTLDQGTWPRSINVGRDRFVIGPWQADRAVAYLTPARSGRRVRSESLQRCQDVLREAGFIAVMTAALHPEETLPFFQCGFHEFDSLAVLGHDLRDTTPSVGLGAGISIRRARRRDLEGVLALDMEAFPPIWRINRDGLDEARRATVRSRYRVADRGGEIIGYSVTGRTKSLGFLQRLATHPKWTGRGIGSALVSDALEWAGRGRCSSLLVNTQQTNRRALELYENLGFVRTATRLTVLRCSL